MSPKQFAKRLCVLCHQHQASPDGEHAWPSFYAARTSDAVILREDRSLGMARVEVICATCHSHLGHVFEGEGYDTPTDQRYCINSISLRLVADEG